MTANEEDAVHSEEVLASDVYSVYMKFRAFLKHMLIIQMKKRQHLIWLKIIDFNMKIYFLQGTVL